MVPQIPMHCIAMDLIERFPPTLAGYRYALSVVWLLTGHVLYIPLFTKEADKVVQAYM